MTPACRVEPTSAADVSAIVKAAVDAKIPFAVHSGGHFMTVGGSNIGQEGFTIDLAGLNTIEIADDEKSVKVGSGNRWEKIFAPLSEKGLHAVGGRDPGIGAGGYLLGGEFSRDNPSCYANSFLTRNASSQVVCLSSPSNMVLVPTMLSSTRSSWPLETL